MKVERFIDTESYRLNFLDPIKYLSKDPIKSTYMDYAWYVSPGNYLMKNRHLMIGWCCHLARHQILRSLEWSFRPLEKK